MHLGLVFSTHDPKLLTYDEDALEVLKVALSTTTLSALFAHYAQSPERIKADKPYILGVLKHYHARLLDNLLDDLTESNNCKKYAQQLIVWVLPFCTKKELMALRGFLVEKLLDPSAFMAKNVKLSDEQAIELISTRTRLLHYLPLLNQQSDSFLKRCVSGTLTEYLRGVAFRFDVNASHVGVALSQIATKSRRTAVKLAAQYYWYLETLFTQHNLTEYLELLQTLQTHPLKPCPSEATILTLNQACRDETVQALSSLKTHWDSLALSQKAIERVKLLALQAWLRDAGNRTDASQVVFLANNKSFETLRVMALFDKECPWKSVVFHYRDPISMYDYVISLYADVVCPVMNWSRSVFKENFPTVYSLVPFMAPQVKTAVWMAKELEQTSATLLHILLTDVNGDAGVSISVRSPTQPYSPPNEKVNTGFSRQTIQIIRLLRSELRGRFESIAFSKTSLEKLGKVLFGTFDVNTQDILHIDVGLQHYKDDPVSESTYLGLLHAGMNVNTLIKYNRKESVPTDIRELNLGTLLNVVNNAPVPLNIDSWLKFITKLPEIVVQSDWVESMAKHVATTDAPDSIYQLIQQWSDSTDAGNSHVISALLHNNLSYLEELPYFSDVVLELSAIPDIVPKTHSNLPAFKVDLGAEYEAYVLQPGDVRALIIGTLTGCCQHLGGAGSSVAISSYTEPDQGVFVVAHKSGKILAESLIWHGDFQHPEKVNPVLTPQNFNGKLLAIDSIESRYYNGQAKSSDEVHNFIAKGYQAFMHAMTKNGYVVGLAPTNNSASKGVVNRIENLLNRPQSDFLKPLETRKVPYQRKVSYCDLQMKKCLGYLPIK